MLSKEQHTGKQRRRELDSLSTSLVACVFSFHYHVIVVVIDSEGIDWLAIGWNGSLSLAQVLVISLQKLIN